MNSYKDLLIWQKSKALAVKVYRLTNDFPSAEVYGLTSQLRRCSVSVPSNIAEGWGRDSDKFFSNSLKIAKGSLYELETQLIIATDLDYLKSENSAILLKEINEISKMIVALIKKINKNNDAL